MLPGHGVRTAGRGLRRPHFPPPKMFPRRGEGMSRRPPQLGHSGLPLGLFLLLRSQPPRPQTGHAGSGAGLLLRSGGRRSPALFLLDELSSDVCWGLGLEQGAVKRETDIKRGKWTEAKRNAAKFFFLFHSVREIPQNRGLRHIPTPRPCCHMAGQVTGSPRRAHPWPPRPHPGCPRRRNEAGCGWRQQLLHGGEIRRRKHHAVLLKPLQAAARCQGKVQAQLRGTQPC